MCNSTKNAVQELIISNSEVMQRLDNSETRLNMLESKIKRVESNTRERVQDIQEWFEDIRERSVPEVSSEIISTLQEVINDSAPGVAVESIRGEMRNMRQTMITAQQMTDGLHGLVLDLSDKIDETSVNRSQPGDASFSRLVEKTEIDSREHEIVRKGIERLEKQLVQSTKSEIVEEPLDIPLLLLLDISRRHCIGR